ncbi:MAG: plasmid mobilization relaxosome protein MobC [Neisseriaceae bacterium]|nr:plasmid mobilization relaxosome protein MobC [Neisseriaceae bacterium]
MKKRVYVYVEDDELEKFKELALQQTGTNNLSLLVRQLLKKELEQSPQTEQSTLFENKTKKHSPVFISPNVEEEKTQNNSSLRIRLSATEKEHFVALAKQVGMSLNALIATILRAYREQNPKLFNNEIAVLQHSNYQLLAIGRNINQIAKRLNAADGVSLTTTQIDQWRAEIQKHCQFVGKVLKESRTRHSYHI